MSSATAEVVPRKSAAVIIYDEREGGRALMVRRSAALRFMALHHAFPGGRISDDEPMGNVIGASDEVQARALHAVAREAFEETGLLLTRGTPPEREEAELARLEVLDNESLFDPWLDKWGMKIHADDFIPAGLWITPKGTPIRFHAQYYLYRFSGEGCVSVIPGELDRVEWMNPGEARRQWRTGDLLLPPPVAYVLQQLEHFPYPACLEPLRRTTHVIPDTPARIEWRAGINIIPLRAPALPPANQTNCVAIGEKEILIVDPATPYPDEQANLKAQIECLLELGGRVAAILLTHAHPDHIGAVEFVRDLYDAPVWAHEITAGRVKFKVDRHLKDNEVIEVAGDPSWRIKCLFTPGHDPGHLCFLEETTKTLIGGDMLATQGTIIVPAEDGGDMTAYLASLERLLDEDYTLLAPSHGLAFEKPKEKVRQYIEHRLAREQKIKAVWDSGAREMKDLLAKAYDDVSPMAWPLAAQSLKAHLIRLGAAD